MLPPESGLYGERVRLRPQELEDAAQFAEWFSNPDLMQWLAVPPFQMSLAAEEAHVRSKLTNDWEHGVNFAIEATDVGDEPVLLGNAELRLISPVTRLGDLGIAIGNPEYWSRGYGEDVVRTICRYGFEDLDLHRIGLTAAGHNARATRAYEKVGFVVEGSMRESRYVSGRYYDTTVMGLLRSEFESGDPQQGRAGSGGGA